MNHVLDGEYNSSRHVMNCVWSGIVVWLHQENLPIQLLFVESTKSWVNVLALQRKVNCAIVTTKVLNSPIAYARCGETP